MISTKLTDSQKLCVEMSFITRSSINSPTVSTRSYSKHDFRQGISKPGLRVSTRTDIERVVKPGIMATYLKNQLKEDHVF